MKKFTDYISYSGRELFIIFLLILSLIIFTSIFTYLFFAKDLKNKNTIINNHDTGIILLDRNDHPFFTFYNANYKKYIPLSQIPLTMRHAVISSEDKDFYNHTGFSLFSIIRALYMNFKSQNQVYGGSTITQQLVKNTLLSSRKKIFRKIQEAVLAQEIERKYSKDEILEMYLNTVYFGEGAFGIENAAKYYFSKQAKQLNLNEEAFLAATLPSPSLFTPSTGNMKQILSHKNIILKKMRQQHYISEEQFNLALHTPLRFQTSKPNINLTASHFALMVRQELMKKYGEDFLLHTGLRVKTTLNLDWQNIAEKAVSDQVKKLHPDNVSNGAAVVIDPHNGEILALVGSINWFDEKFGKMNLAITPRSVGSSFKPIVYAAAFENHMITPQTILHDIPTTFDGGYRPVNYDRSYRGNVTVRRALSNSLNIPAVEIMQKVGLTKALEISKRLGITSLKDPSNYGLSLVLGSGEVNLLEMTNVYAAFANQGVKYKPSSILEITNKQGNIIYSYNPDPIKVLDPQVTSQITSILSDNKARKEEFGSLLNIPIRAAVKTGTAEDWRDSLTFGYTPDIAVGVWVGNNDNSPMDGIAGSLGAAPIWKTLMLKLSPPSQKISHD